MAASQNSIPPSYENVALNQSAVPAYTESQQEAQEFPKLHYLRPNHPGNTKVHQISWVKVTVGKGTRGKLPRPAIQLHANPSSRIIADVKFSNTPSTDITIYQAPELGNASEANHYTLGHEGVITRDVHFFTFTTRGSRVAKFEWLHSGADEVKGLATTNIAKENFSQSDHGLKLVMAGDDHGERKAPAVYSGGTRSHVLNPRKIAGKLRFLQENIEVDDINGFKLVVVMTVLSMMERGRQHAMKNSEWYCTVS